MKTKRLKLAFDFAKKHFFVVEYHEKTDLILCYNMNNIMYQYDLKEMIKFCNVHKYSYWINIKYIHEIDENVCAFHIY